jgi:hypothetical protein
MAKLDRLGWAAGKSFSSFGVRFGVRVNDDSILEALAELLPPGTREVSAPVVDHLYSLISGRAKSGSKVRPFSLAYWNLERIARARSGDDMLEAFASHLQLTVAEYAPRRVFVHAGVVGWRGKAIVLPGRSFSGKTTLVTELIRAGATYYSDEYAVFDARGRVHPYPRALGIRENGYFNSNKVRAEKLGASLGTKPLQVGLVISTAFKKDARWRPRTVSQGKAVLELLANTVSARSRPENALKVLPEALSASRTLKGARGEAAEVVDSILRLCEDR